MKLPITWFKFKLVNKILFVVTVDFVLKHMIDINNKILLKVGLQLQGGPKKSRVTEEIVLVLYL